MPRTQGTGGLIWARAARRAAAASLFGGSGVAGRSSKRLENSLA